MAPVTTRPLPGQPETFFSLKLQEMRRHEHDLALCGRPILAGNWDSCRTSFKYFDGCLRLAEFELRHGIIRSWPGFVLLLHKLYGPFILPWAAPLFLAAVGLTAMLPVKFDLAEVLEFASQLTSTAASSDGRGQGNMRHGIQDSDLRSRGLEIWRGWAA